MGILNIDTHAASANAASVRAHENALRLTRDALQIAERIDSRRASVATIDIGLKAARRPRRRSFQSAKRNRLTRDLFGHGQSLGPHVYRSLRTLRANSRHMARNNDWFIKFLRMCRINVVGPEGMTYEAQAKTPRGKPDDKLNDLVEQHWQLWGYPENASANGRLSWHDIQLKWITTLARDGEVMFRKVPAANPYGFALKQIDVAWLDETYSETRPNGNRVIMSVEIDDNDRHVGYWLTPPADAYFGGMRPAVQRRTFVSAEDIYFDFIPFDQNCGDETVTRGVPWAHAAMLKLWTIGEFEYAAVVAARIGASKMGFYQDRQGDPLSMSKEELERNAEGKGPTSDDDDDDGELELLDHVEPGIITDIGNKEFKTADWKYPSDLVKPFLSFMLHSVTASLGPEYYTFASDLTEVNFSAGRLGWQNENDHWSILQSPFKYRYRAVNVDWLKSSMLSNAFPLEPRDIIRLSTPQITAREKDYYDPLKDVQADVMECDNGLNNQIDILAKKGRNFWKNLEKLKTIKEAAKAAGVVFVGGKPTSGSAPENQPQDPKDPNGDSAASGG